MIHIYHVLVRVTAFYTIASLVSWIHNFGRIFCFVFFCLKGQNYAIFFYFHITDISRVPSVEMSAEKPPLVGSCRLVLTVMVFFGVYHLMALRFNLSMALGEISCSLLRAGWKLFQFAWRRIPLRRWWTTTQWWSRCVQETEVSLTETKEFQWSKSLQGLLLSCFFYGYILTQIIGGYFSDKVRAGFMLLNPGYCCLSLVGSQSSWWGCWPSPPARCCSPCWPLRRKFNTKRTDGDS